MNKEQLQTVLAEKDFILFRTILLIILVCSPMGVIYILSPSNNIFNNTPLLILLCLFSAGPLIFMSYLNNRESLINQKKIFTKILEEIDEEQKTVSILESNSKIKEALTERLKNIRNNLQYNEKILKDLQIKNALHREEFISDILFDSITLFYLITAVFLAGIKILKGDFSTQIILAIYATYIGVTLMMMLLDKLSTTKIIKEVETRILKDLQEKKEFKKLIKKED